MAGRDYSGRAVWLLHLPSLQPMGLSIWLSRAALSQHAQIIAQVPVALKVPLVPLGPDWQICNFQITENRTRRAEQFYTPTRSGEKGVGYESVAMSRSSFALGFELQSKQQHFLQASPPGCRSVLQNQSSHEHRVKLRASALIGRPTQVAPDGSQPLQLSWPLRSRVRAPRQQAALQELRLGLWLRRLPLRLSASVPPAARRAAGGRVPLGVAPPTCLQPVILTGRSSAPGTPLEAVGGGLALRQLPQGHPSMWVASDARCGLQIRCGPTIDGNEGSV